SEPSWPPSVSSPRMCSGICTWITSAPQSASCRAAVGPARTCVMSITRKRASACEAGRCGMSGVLQVAVEELERALPRELRGGLVVARSAFVVEAVLRVGIDERVVLDVVRLQHLLERGPAAGDAMVLRG